MRMVYVSKELEQIEFAKRAAEAFAKNEKLASYTDGEIIPGCFFALRWGLRNDCVVVFKLDCAHVPTNYQELVRAVAGEKKTVC